jgi:heat-inducible transcriptional repressor
MSDLSERKKQLLKEIIEYYVKTGEPVASDSIEKCSSLGVSPATIRNEMVELTEMGFLKQPHVSAGRVPTSMGFRLYINELMKEKELPIVDEVNIRQQMMDSRPQFDKMVHVATRALAEKCDALAIAINGDDVYYAGAANILDLPEFFDIDVTRFVLSMLDESAILEKVINMARGSDPMHIIFGEETEYEYLQPTSFAFLNFETGKAENGVIGVIGPDRLNFPLVLPYIKYIGEVLSEASRI